MEYSPSPHRRLSDDPPPRRYTGFSNDRLSPERQFRPSRRNTERDDDEFDFSYGGEPLPALTASWEPQPATESYEFLNTSPRTLSPTSGSYITEENISSILSYVEGIENDGTKAGEVEEAGLSWTVTLPANNEQSMPYTHISDSNSAWKARKYHDKKIGTTTLESIYSIKYSTGEMGQGKITLFCPQGPIRDNEDSALVQAKWLHVERSSMSVRVLEKLVMDCPIINADIRRVAVLLLDSVEKSFLRESENGAYIEPGSVLRLTGTRQVLHDSHDLMVTEPVIFAAFPFIELASSKNNNGSRESEDFYPRTLLQNLYGFDVVTSRGKNQVIHKMPVNCLPDNTLFVNQLWCLVIGSDILITMSDRSPDDLLGVTIEKRTDYFRQPLRIEVVDVNGFQHSMSISAKTPWVDFFRHVIHTVHGNLIGIMDYDLVDQADGVVTTERWAELAEATQSSLLKFHLVKRKVSASRSSSISSRRSSRSGIRRLLLLDYAPRDNPHGSRTSLSRYHTDKYDVNPSSSEKKSTTKRASTPRRVGTSRSWTDDQWHSPPAKMKIRQSGAQPEIFSERDIHGLYPQSSPTVITLESSEEEYSGPEKISPSLHNIQSVGDCSEGASDKSDSSPRNVAQPLEQQQQLPSSGDFDKGSPLVGLSIDGHSLIHEQQAPASSIEEQRETAISLEDNFFYINDGYTNEKSKEEAPDLLIVTDTASSTEDVDLRPSDEGSDEHEEVSTSQSHTPATMYQKVQIEDGSETSDEDDIRKRTHSGLTGADLPGISSQLNLDDVLVPNDEHNSDSDYNGERSPETRFIFVNDINFPRTSSHERYHSRSSSLSNSTDESLYSRGRTRIRKRRAWTRESPSLAHSSSSRPTVRFQPQVRNTNKDSVEMSPYGSSNATKVEARRPQPAVPFFFWKQQSMTSTFSSIDSPEQVLIKLLDQIDEHISNDPVSKYYLKVPEMTLEDVLSRQESLREPGWEKESKTPQGESGKAKTSVSRRIIDIRTDNLFTFYLSENQVGKTNKESDQNNAESAEALSTNLSNEEAINPNTDRRESNPDPEYAPSSINISPDRGEHEETQFRQTQALGLVSHDKTLARQLVETSQQIIWSFIPNTGGSLIHTLLKRLWGCVDIMCLQLLWEENERGRESECTYIISNFCSQVKKTDPHRQKPTSEKIHYLHCEDCKTAKPYQLAMDALDHLHERHIECKYNDSGRPYDDPCYVWLHRIWHDGYPMRSSRDGLLGIMEDFIEELSYISNYVRELHNMTTTDSLANDAVSTPPLSMNITHAFQQIVKMFVFRSKQLSLINRRRSLIGGSSLASLENIRLKERIDRKIEELFSLEMDANERIIDRLESAKKDIFLSGIGSHSEILEAETVRVQFLALALMSGIQKPLFQPSVMRRSQVKDTLLQLYKDYTSRLHFEANNRPRKRVFLDIHGLEEELQALNKLVDSQESCLYNFLTLIDPLTSRYTTETRLREFRVEVQFGNDQLHHRIEKRREIDNLATRLWILKDQVKQTIEIMEEDHGKAIRVFTVVTLFFLPLSFVSSFLGMNTTDVRNSEWNQAIFWITAVPITVGVLSLAFVYGYKGEEIRDWMIQVLQNRSHQGTPSAFYEMSGRPSLETKRREWNPARSAEQNKIEKRGFSSLVRSRIQNVPGWQHRMNGTSKVSNELDGRVAIRRRNTEDSLAPLRHE